MSAKSRGEEGVEIGQACDRIVAKAPKPSLSRIPVGAGHLPHGRF